MSIFTSRYFSGARDLQARLKNYVADLGVGMECLFDAIEWLRAEAKDALDKQKTEEKKKQIAKAKYDKSGTGEASPSVWFIVCNHLFKGANYTAILSKMKSLGLGSQDPVTRRNGRLLRILRSYIFEFHIQYVVLMRPKCIDFVCLYIPVGLLQRGKAAQSFDVPLDLNVCLILTTYKILGQLTKGALF